MAKTRMKFVCSGCGAVYEKWQGRCTGCDSWNLIEEVLEKPKNARPTIALGHGPQPISVIASNNFVRDKTGISELDRVLGGGVVPGSVILISGDPGIGKSTLVLQLAAAIAEKKTVLYATGEESGAQVAGRAQRLGIQSDSVLIYPDNAVENIIATVEKTEPDLLIIDSIQTIYSLEVTNVPGNISQIVTTTQILLALAKAKNIPVVIVGHVTKEGNIAGPKTLEHLVDTVLYLEGNRYGSFRVLKTSKNRFGATNETGVFEMTEKGLMVVDEPSKLLLAERNKKQPGSVVFPALEGTRSFMVEVQALTSITNFGYPKRTASGMDLNRLQLLIAVLSKRGNINLSNHDVYVNIVGGIYIKETALDLAVCMAIVSAFKDKAPNEEAVIFGEVGLAGEIRQADNVNTRVAEAKRNGFKRALVAKSQKVEPENFKLGVEDLAQAVKILF